MLKPIKQKQEIQNVLCPKYKYCKEKEADIGKKSTKNLEDFEAKIQITAQIMRLKVVKK